MLWGVEQCQSNRPVGATLRGSMAASSFLDQFASQFKIRWKGAIQAD